MKSIPILLMMLMGGAILAQGPTTFELAGHQLQVVGDLQQFEIGIKSESVSEELGIATLTLTHSQGAVPPVFSIRWGIPSSNIAGYWSSGSFTDKTIQPDWGPSQVRSMLAREAPVICLFGHNDENRMNFAVSEALNTVVSSTSVREEDGLIYNEILFFSEKHNEIKTYEVQIRLDTRPIPYSKSLQEVADWWASFEKYRPISVPEVARMPVYSTWYSYHQNISVEPLLEECKLAKALGFESIIVDDGWQTLDSNRGYAYTGDWEAERIPEMKEFVKKVHDLGMKFILWYAVPFVGEKSMAYQKMKGKFLTYWEGQGTYVLDPRFPEVRKFIIDTYKNAATEWNLDGFKLDFVARFRAYQDTELVAEPGRDYASVNQATDVLMTDLVQSLKAINPDIMIEFRQPYAGPAMRKYGNMFRAADCPNLAMINRIRTSDLRMLSGSTAVHSDMLMWHYQEPVEIAALQLLNVMFSVPQISVRLGDIPTTHFDMIKFYTGYWVENRNILIEGQFHASSPLANYPVITGWGSKKSITAVFDDQVIAVNNKFDSFDLINAKTSSQLVINVDGAVKQYRYLIKDCFGKEIKKETIVLKPGLYSFNVPGAGLITFNAPEQ